MKAGRCWGIGRLAVAGLVFTGAVPGWAQNSPFGDGAVVQNIPGPRPYGMGGESDPVLAARRIRSLNTERHKSMVSDADKLVKLARQLDAEIASNPSDDLTPEEVHQVAEIEKLARNVKAKMAQTFDAGTRVGTSFMPMAGQSPQ
jgi:hypothetical protein